MSEWIDGPPPDQTGAYACEFRRSVGHVYAYNFWDGRWRTHTGCPFDMNREAIVRHCRIPDLPKPLPLPRRFRGRYKGKPVVGVEVKSLGGILWLTEPAELAHSFSPHEIDAVEWIDPEPTQEAQP